MPSAEEFLSAPKTRSADAFLTTPAAPAPAPAPKSADSFLGPPPAPRASPKPLTAAVDYLKAKGGELAGDYAVRNREARAQMKQGADDFGVRADNPAAGVGGALNLVGGAFNYLASPVNAAIDTVVGRPVSKATGGRLQPRDVGDAALAVEGFLVGPKKAGAPRAPEGVRYDPKFAKPVAEPKTAGAATRVAPAAPSADAFLAGKKGAKPSADAFLGDDLAAPPAPRALPAEGSPAPKIEAPAFSGTPRAQQTLHHNAVTDLGNHADRLYRETAPDKLELFVPGGQATDLVHTGGDLFMSDHPNLALGQGANKGVTLEFDAKGLSGRVSMAKPTAQLGYEQGLGSEYVARHNQVKNLKDNLRSFRVSKDIQTTPALRVRLQRLMGQLEKRGWTKTETDGYVQYERPGAAPEPVPTAAAPIVTRSADAFLAGDDLAIPPVPERAKAIAAAEPDNLDEIFAPLKRSAIERKARAEMPPKTVAAHVMDGARAVQHILAPATAGVGREAAAVMRKTGAQGDLLTAQATHDLMSSVRVADKLPVEQQRALVDYIEKRSTGATIADPALQGAADNIRDVFDRYRNRIAESLGEEGPTFIDDYYTHMWKESPQAVGSRMQMSRQGSGRNLKARSIPTLAEGIEAGLTPVYENPVEATMAYAQNMSKYIATVDTLKELDSLGLAKWYDVGKAPEGYVALKGIHTTKPGQMIFQDGELVANRLGKQRYAPADAARVYNNWISKGLETGDAGPLFEGARKVSNGMVMLKLGLSAFHAFTLVHEGVISATAQGIKAATAGRPLAAAKAFAGAYASPVSMYARGSRMTKELLGGGPEAYEGVNKAFVEAGGRTHMDTLYRARASGSFYNSLAKGTFKTDVKKAFKRIAGNNPSLVDRGMGIIDLGANLIQSFSAPLFEHYIPRLKQGAFAQTMEDWMAANPSATAKEVNEAASLINRSIDNRFGEMAWDNLFWHRELKQASQMLLLSPSWNVGTINEIGGGIVDVLGPSAKGLLAGKGVTDRTAYVAALAVQVAILNGVMTYLKTGKAPDEARDFMAYETGGVDATSGQPERALTPGYQKDVYAFTHDFPNHIGQEVKNKLNVAPKAAVELLTNKDFRGLPIRPADGAVVQPGDAGLPEYMLELMSPISVSALRKGQKDGSNISLGEQLLAIRAAPSYLQAPERQHLFKQVKNRKDWNRKRKADNRAKNIRDGE